MERFAAPANLVPPAASPAEFPCREVPSPLDTRHVPFIAVTAGEGGLDIPRVAKRADGWIRYETPGPYDRYPDTDVLLARTRGTGPCGPPDGNVLSPFRQAHCMLNRRCQGCGLPAERSDAGVLVVLPAVRSDGRPGATSGVSDMPPSCARCALRCCPVLSARGRRLLWAREAEVIGVYGEVLLPPDGAERPAEASRAVPGAVRWLSERLVLFEDGRTLSATVATRLVCDLRRVSDADPRHIADLARRAASRTPANAAAGCGGAGAATGVRRPV
ncbi:hypothetical protein [Streptomyces sp. NBRC 110465]|uniref:hypothetical protein n=1 Tax=Streptomyces sp. NBRC 110465 TaxID=1897621 RepID=UPI000933CBA0|nr:hypothetical protein [Streptomyces sp. NBRC 110465]